MWQGGKKKSLAQPHHHHFHHSESSICITTTSPTIISHPTNVSNTIIDTQNSFRGTIIIINLKILTSLGVKRKKRNKRKLFLSAKSRKLILD